MNEVMKKPEAEEMAKSQSVEEKIEAVQAVVRKIGGGPAITVLIFSVVLLAIGAAFVARAITVAGRSAGEAFQRTRTEVQEDVYQKHYSDAYEKAENAHHVSNRISISISDIQKMQKLEVLQVSNVAYITEDDVGEGEEAKDLWSGVVGIFEGKLTAWIEAIGEGSFTVNMKASEFIVDNERQYVLVRIPRPSLDNFTLDQAKAVYVNDDGVKKRGTSDGVDLAARQRRYAWEKLKKEVESDQFFYESAEKAAETILENLVKGINSDIPELTVEVEFID